jgi:Holliday junction resolvase-like predicted endonuclease
MEQIFENIVMHYLSRNGSTFLVPQYSIRDDRGAELTCPDLVTLDLPATAVHVVEVKTAPHQRLAELVSNLNAREGRWFAPLRRHLQRLGFPVDDGWSFGCRVFVRKEAVDYVKRGVTDPTSVSIEALEDVAFPWRWSWPRADR